MREPRKTDGPGGVTRSRSTLLGTAAIVAAAAAVLWLKVVFHLGSAVMRLLVVVALLAFGLMWIKKWLR